MKLDPRKKLERICPCGIYVDDDGNGCSCSPWGFATYALLYVAQGDYGEAPGRTAEELRDWALESWTAQEFVEALHRLRAGGVVEICGFSGARPSYALTADLLAAFERDEVSAYRTVVSLFPESPEANIPGFVR